MPTATYSPPTVCSMVPRLSVFALLSSAALSAAGCGACDDRDDNQARLFLDRVQRVHIDAPVEEREELVDALAALSLDDEELAGTRDACVAGHRALIEAEREQQRAALALAEVSDGDPNALVEPAKAREIQEAIERSNGGIERARDELSRCQDEVDALDSRYGSER